MMGVRATRDAHARVARFWSIHSGYSINEWYNAEAGLRGMAFGTRAANTHTHTHTHTANALKPRGLQMQLQLQGKY